MGLLDDDQIAEAETVVAEDDIDDVVDGGDEGPVAAAAEAVNGASGEAGAAVVTLNQAVTEYFSYEEQKQAKRDKRRATGKMAASTTRKVFILTEEGRQSINRFLSHIGPATPLVELSPNGMERYQAVLGDRTPNLGDKLQPVKELLRFCWKQGYCDQNLGNHLKVKRPTGAAGGKFQTEEAETFEMTAAGLQALKDELSAAEARYPEVVAEVAAAREDKDIRENAPLEAAREEQDRLRTRMNQLEYQIAHAVVYEAADTGKAQIGSLISVIRLSGDGGEQGEPREYNLVGSSEANAAERKISIDSPLGRGLLDQSAGREIEIDAPSGPQRFRLLSVAAAPASKR